ncbi:MAG: hypothetical protein AAF934_03100, partial [Bacteroidota bacterium]
LGVPLIPLVFGSGFPLYLFIVPLRATGVLPPLNKKDAATIPNAIFLKTNCPATVQRTSFQHLRDQIPIL